ncbi:MAG: uroporphyrinogen decarboxylase family protein [Anaerolineales bacterium]
MSYSIGMDALNLKPTPRVAHTEYCSNDALKRAVTGLPDDHPHREAAFYERWNYDFIWSTDDGPEPWDERGRVTDMGHSEFLEGGVDRREPRPCPFRSVEEVWAFDAVAEYGLTDFEDLVSFYQGLYRQARQEYPEQVWTGGYYRTLFSGAIAIFGWEMLLRAAADASRFARVLDGIFQQSLHHYKAWAKTSIEVFMCHDDMVWSQGPFMHPDFYRAEIFPRYRVLWSILKEAGKKVVYTSDGDWSMFVGDIVDAGADALCFEPMLPLEPVVVRYGQTHCILGSKVDARTLTFGTRAQIRQEVDASLTLAKECAGFIFAVGNHIPSNVPVEKARFYYDYLRRHWGRGCR